jgi:hypothetical protein
MPITNIGKLAKHELDKISHPPEDINLPNHDSILSDSLRTRNSHCSIVNFLSEIGIPSRRKGRNPAYNSEYLPPFAVLLSADPTQSLHS